MATSTKPVRRKQASAAVPPESRWREHHWMGFSFEAPADWEVVRHNLQRLDGEIAMVDRRRQRLSFEWKRPKRQPDVQATLDRARENERINAPNRKLRTLEGIGIWRGYSRERVTRLMTWDRQRNLWLDLVLLWPDGMPDPDVEARIARSFEVGPEPPGPRMTAREVATCQPTRWRAFGIDMTAPPGWAFDEAEVKSLNVCYYLHDARQPRRAVEVRRSAMADAWFDGNLETHIRTVAGARQTYRFTNRQHRGHPAVLGESTEPTRIGTKVFRGARQRKDLAWFDEQANSVYTISAFSIPRAPLEPDEFQVEGYCTR